MSNLFETCAAISIVALSITAIVLGGLFAYVVLRGCM
jgi:hypothetical protein